MTETVEGGGQEKDGGHGVQAGREPSPDDADEGQDDKVSSINTVLAGSRINASLLPSLFQAMCQSHGLPWA